MTSDPAELRQRMVDMIVADDCLTAWQDTLTPWCPALRTVPRHAFLPDTIWVDNDDPDGTPFFVPLHRAQDPDRWLSLAYADTEGVATQIDDGKPEGPHGGGSLPTSSLSGPVIVAVMLAALDAQPGHRVLEIGTGTGYNAALLAHRLGVEAVTSIEIDASVAAGARKALTETGYGEVQTVIADGTWGYAPGAPYDRVIATAAAHWIPYAWVEQTRPGGRVLLPWANTFDGGLLALTVADDGTATGSIVADSAFMALRQQRDRGAVKPTGAPTVVDDPEFTTTRKTTLHPHYVVGSQAARLAIAQRVPGCRWRYWPWEENDPVGVLWLFDPWDSWAKFTHYTQDLTEEDDFEVIQHGPRRLWDEAEAAVEWWIEQGKPGVDRWRFTVTSQGQQIILQDS